MRYFSFSFLTDNFWLNFKPATRKPAAKKPAAKKAPAKKAAA